MAEKSIRGSVLALVLPSVIVTIILVLPSICQGQYTTIGTPFRTVNDSFYERVGVDFGFQIPGSGRFTPGDRTRGVFGLLPNGQINPSGHLVFSQNSARSAIPPVGGYDPGAEAQFGYAVRNRNGGGYHLNLFGGKGSNRSLTSTTPSVTVPNGFTGTIRDQTLQPFVTGITPVVGGYNNLSPGPVSYISPLEVALRRLREQGETLAATPDPERERIALYGRENVETRRVSSPQSSLASQGDLSVAEIKRSQKAQQLASQTEMAKEIQDRVDAAEIQIAKGNFSGARVLLKQAIRRATGTQRATLDRRYEQIKGKRNRK